jgi:hypothetical protein
VEDQPRFPIGLILAPVGFIAFIIIDFNFARPLDDGDENFVLANFAVGLVSSFYLVSFFTEGFKHPRVVAILIFLASFLLFSSSVVLNLPMQALSMPLMAIMLSSVIFNFIRQFY